MARENSAKEVAAAKQQAIEAVTLAKREADDKKAGFAKEVIEAQDRSRKEVTDARASAAAEVAVARKDAEDKRLCIFMDSSSKYLTTVAASSAFFFFKCLGN